MAGNRRYAITGSGDGGGNTTTVIAMLSATTVKPEIYDVVIGCSGTAADNVANIAVKRLTAVGTEGSGVTPRALDPDAPAALADGAEGHTAEPTYTASSELLEIALNQRATFRWVAAPGSGLVAPSTANNGIGMQIVTGPSLVYDGTFLFQE